MELPEDQRLPFGIAAYTSPLTLLGLGLRSQMGPEGTFQPTSQPTNLQPFLPLVQLVSGSLLHLVSPRVAQGFSQIPGTTDPVIDRW